MDFKNYSVLFLLIVFLPFCASGEEKKLYSFADSPSKEGYKHFKHDLFGFEVDVPNDWVFGIITKGGIPVVGFYPEEVELSQLSEQWQMIEIGILPRTDAGLEGAYGTLRIGLEASNYQVDKIYTEASVHGNKAIAFNAFLNSRTGWKVRDQIFLVRSGLYIYSLKYSAVINEENPIADISTVLKSFEPSEPMQGLFGK